MARPHGEHKPSDLAQLLLDQINDPTDPVFGKTEDPTRAFAANDLPGQCIRVRYGDDWFVVEVRPGRPPARKPRP